LTLYEGFYLIIFKLLLVLVKISNMKTLFMFFSICLIGLISGCNQPKSYEKDTEALLQTDKDFNTYCSQHGINAAFLLFADSSLIESRQGALPLMGIAELKKAQKSDSGVKLSWGPARGEVSNNLGYTFGWWKYETKTKRGTDTNYYGDYVNVWKKQKDGSWKYLIDIGNDTPRPPERN
jgi:ketosteroid isomerase-like protein